MYDEQACVLQKITASFQLTGKESKKKVKRKEKKKIGKK